MKKIFSLVILTILICIFINVPVSKAAMNPNTKAAVSMVTLQSVGSGNYFYKFKNNEWEQSTDRNTWTKVTNTTDPIDISAGITGKSRSTGLSFFLQELKNRNSIYINGQMDLADNSSVTKADIINNSTFLTINAENQLVYTGPTPMSTASILPSASPTSSTGGAIDSKITKPTDLPEVFTDVSKTINFIINLLIGISGGLFIVMLFWGGWLYIISAGGEGSEKAKRTLLTAVIGIIVVAVSWVVASFILQKLGLK